jgi:hypothetical protein
MGIAGVAGDCYCQFQPCFVISNHILASDDHKNKDEEATETMTGLAFQVCPIIIIY